MTRERAEAQKQVSRLSGAQSHSPVTERGKAISARSALRDGLAVNPILIHGESPGEFQRLLAGHAAGFEPEIRNAVAHAREIQAQPDRLPETVGLHMPTRVWLALENIDESGNFLRRACLIPQI